MSTPPRRRRPEPRRSQSTAGGGWLPTAALGLGVIVAGLGIGALVAVLMGRSSSNPPAVATVTSTPAPPPAATRAPLVVATFVPPRTPRPSPRPRPAASGAPSAGPSPQATGTPTATPTAGPSPTQAASAEPDATVAPAGASRVAVVTSAPLVTQTAAPTTAPPATATPEPAGPTPTTFSVTTAGASNGASTYAEHASAVVRRYIDALVRGDLSTAYSALGTSAGTSPGALTEQSFIDSSAHIVSLKVERVDAANASVGCEITSAKGHYYATYHVTAGTGGPYISEHDYIKV